MTTSQPAPDLLGAPLAGGAGDRRLSRRAPSTGSIDSVLSAGSILSIGSAGSILSVGSTGSILSIGSTGSILSIGSAGSILSVGSVGSLLSRGSRRKVLCIDDQPMTNGQRLGHVGLALAIVGAITGLAAILHRRNA